MKNGNVETAYYSLWLWNEKTDKINKHREIKLPEAKLSSRTRFNYSLKDVPFIIRVHNST